LDGQWSADLYVTRPQHLKRGWVSPQAEWVRTREKQREKKEEEEDREDGKEKREKRGGNDKSPTTV